MGETKLDGREIPKPQSQTKLRISLLTLPTSQFQNPSFFSHLSLTILKSLSLLLLLLLPLSLSLTDQSSSPLRSICSRRCQDATFSAISSSYYCWYCHHGHLLAPLNRPISSPYTDEPLADRSCLREFLLRTFLMFCFLLLVVMCLLSFVFCNQ